MISMSTQAAFEQFKGDRFTEEYRKFKGQAGRKYGYDRYLPPLPSRSKSSPPKESTSPPAVRRVVGGRTKFVPSGLEDDEDEMDSGSDAEPVVKSPVSADLMASFKPYDGGAKKLSDGGGLLASLSTDSKSSSAFSGLREGVKIRKRGGSDDEDDSDDDRKKANMAPADDGEEKPDTLAFTNDAISLEQVSTGL